MHLPSPAESLPLLRLKHPQICLSTNSGKAEAAFYFSVANKAISIKVGALRGFLFVLFFGSECWEYKTLFKTTSLSDLPWITLWRPTATPSHFLQRARAQHCTPRFSVRQPSLHRWSALHGRQTRSLSTASLCLKRGRALLTRAHFLCSDLALDFPKTEPLVRCLLNTPSRQPKRYLSCSSEL